MIVFLLFDNLENSSSSVQETAGKKLLITFKNEAQFDFMKEVIH